MLTTLLLLACGQMALPQRPANFGTRGCRNRSCWTRVSGRGAGVDAAPVVLQSQEILNFGSAAGGPAPSRPTFAQSTLDGTPLAYLFYVKSDCSVACVTDDAQTPCAGITWTGGTGATCRLIWTGDWALTDITDAKAWKFRTVTASPANLFASDFSLTVFGYATSKESANAMMFQIYTGTTAGDTEGAYLRNQSGTVSALWFEDGSFPTANASVTSYNGFNLTTAHRKGTHHNVMVNGSENSDVVASHAMAGSAVVAGGVGFNDATAGQAMGGQFVWAAVNTSNLTAANTSVILTRATGAPQADAGTLTLPGTGTLLCFDKADAGQADCMLGGTPYLDERGMRTWSGERATSKWAADPLDVSSWTAVNSPGVVTDVKAGPFFEVRHSNEMDRIVDSSGSFAGYKSNASSFTHAPLAYTECVYLSVGDGGTSDKARLELTVSNGLFMDGGTVVDCDFAGLTDTPALKSCTATLNTFDGGVDLRGAVYVGNAAADTGSLTVGHARLNPGVACEPAELGNAAVGDGYLLFDVSGWRSDSSGAEHEVVWTPLATGGSASSTNSPYADWSNELFDPIYLHDAYDNSSNHIVTFIHGYTLPGHLLMRFNSIVNNTSVDITADGISLTAGATYATAAKWLPSGGGNCALSALENQCNGSIASCVATTSIAAGSGGCPDQPPNLKLGQRYDNSVPTDAWILSVRHKTP